MNILIVEDSLAVCERLGAMLVDIEQVHQVRYAIDEREAYATFTRMQALHEYLDTVILDIQLGDGSGINVLRFVKIHSPQTRVIMLTNHATQQYRDLCAREGADYFFDKSTEFMQLPELLCHSSSARKPQ